MSFPIGIRSSVSQGLAPPIRTAKLRKARGVALFCCFLVRRDVRRSCERQAKGGIVCFCFFFEQVPSLSEYL